MLNPEAVFLTIEAAKQPIGIPEKVYPRVLKFVQQWREIELDETHLACLQYYVDTRVKKTDPTGDIFKSKEVAIKN